MDLKETKKRLVFLSNTLGMVQRELEQLLEQQDLSSDVKEWRSMKGAVNAPRENDCDDYVWVSIDLELLTQGGNVCEGYFVKKDDFLSVTCNKNGNGWSYNHTASEFQGWRIPLEKNG